jgi:hypothetical protein
MNGRIVDALSLISEPENRLWIRNADYRIEHDIDLDRVRGFCGSLSIANIVLMPNGRFDLPDGHGAPTVEGTVIQALDKDGEKTIDLVAWPTASPTDVRSLLGRAPLVGLWAAFNSGTYFCDCPLIMHRTPLAWLQADCNGAAVVVPELAARTFLQIAEMGGRIAAQDFAHERELKSHLKAMIDRVAVVSPKRERRAA